MLTRKNALTHSMILVGLLLVFSMVGSSAALAQQDTAYLSAVHTTAAFSESGAHVLRLTADDGELTASDEVTIVAESEGEVTTVEVRVAASSDDAEERASGSMRLTSSDLELVYDRTDQQTVGMRFNRVDIPQGAMIVNAYLQFQADETSSEVTSLTIRGEDIDDAPLPSPEGTYRSGQERRLR